MSLDDFMRIQMWMKMLCSFLPILKVSTAVYQQFRNKIFSPIKEINEDSQPVVLFSKFSSPCFILWTNLENHSIHSINWVIAFSGQGPKWPTVVILNQLNWVIVLCSLVVTTQEKGDVSSGHNWHKWKVKFAEWINNTVSINSWLFNKSL